MKKKIKGVNHFQLTKFDDYSKEALIEIILEQIAVQHEHDIQNDLLMDLVSRYVSRSEELKEKIREIERISITDPLTQIYNRIHLNKQFAEELDRYHRYKHSFALIMLDIDHFKNVNDTYGHIVGDHTLIALTRLVNRMIRSVDVFARWGGEEFILIIVESNLEAATDLAERIRLKVQEYEFESVGQVTCSFGVTCVQEYDDLRTMSLRVDKALYEAKNTGRNKVISE
jgi:diguanylate cyclase (GGDEF)-like protein